MHVGWAMCETEGIAGGWLSVVAFHASRQGSQISSPSQRLGLARSGGVSRHKLPDGRGLQERWRLGGCDWTWTVQPGQTLDRAGCIPSQLGDHFNTIRLRVCFGAHSDHAVCDPRGQPVHSAHQSLSLDSAWVRRSCIESCRAHVELHPFRPVRRACRGSVGVSPRRARYLKVFDQAATNGLLRSQQARRQGKSSIPNEVRRGSVEYRWCYVKVIHRRTPEAKSELAQHDHAFTRHHPTVFECDLNRHP